MTRSTRLVSFRGHETWVQVTEPEDARPGALPLFVLHGGPGMAYNYVRNIAELAAETGRTVIHYDQIGCGNSTHLPDAPADFWTPDLFVDEFHTVRAALGIDEYHLLGQSWGGMLSAEIAVRRPSGLASLAICNSPASMELWMAAAAELRAQLPPDTQAALTRHEEAGTVSDPGYLAATEEFYRRHVCRVVPTPQDFVDTIAQMEAEPTVYHTLNGPNEFHVLGTLRGWSIIDRLHRITAPTLVIAGEFDEATPATWQPYVEQTADVRSHVFPDTSHCTHLEKPEEFRAVVAEFLSAHDADHEVADTARDRPAAVFDEPRPRAAELPVQDQQPRGADGGDPHGQRDQRCARAVLRRPDRTDLVTGEFWCAVWLLTAPRLGRLVLRCGARAIVQRSVARLRSLATPRRRPACT